MIDLTKRRINNARYKKSVKGQIAEKKYINSLKGKETHKRAVIKYINSEHGKIMRNKEEQLRAPLHNINWRHDLIMENCAICNSSKIELHHPNNKLPLHVYWLCKKHHVEQHYKRIENNSILKECED
jgi:hypothetical protein